jgi:hypothetical protein
VESAAQAIGTTVTRWKTYYQRDGKPNAELAIIEYRQVDQNVLSSKIFLISRP